MELSKLFDDALTRGRTDKYNGNPQSVDECVAHLVRVFNVPLTVSKEHVTKYANEWFTRHALSPRAQ